LSVATFDNWVTKTVNFLRLEVDVSPGDSVRVDLRLHWMTAVWMVAVWEAGAHLSDQGPALTVSSADDADVLVVLDPFGMATAPADAASEWTFPADVRGMPDQLVLPPVPPGGIADGPHAAELRHLATEYAAEVGLGPGGRLLTGLPVTGLTGRLATIAAALAVDAAVIYAESPGQERPTATAR
jgi:uncharacterized protein (TIGR03089 family)